MSLCLDSEALQVQCLQLLAKLKRNLRMKDIDSPGAGEVDWTLLAMVCPSELLRFEEASAAALAALQLPQEDNRPRSAGHQDRPRSPSMSPRGLLLILHLYILLLLRGQLHTL